MQTKTMQKQLDGAYGAVSVGINGYTKDGRQDAVIQVHFNGGGASMSVYFSPDAAREVAAALAAAATAADMPQG